MLRFQLYSMAGAKLKRVACLGVELERGSIGVEKIVSADSCVPLMTIDRVEGQHPSPRETIFPGCIDEDGSTGRGVSAKTCAGAIHADIAYVHAA